MTNNFTYQIAGTTKNFTDLFDAQFNNHIISNHFETYLTELLVRNANKEIPYNKSNILLLNDIAKLDDIERYEAYFLIKGFNPSTSLETLIIQTNENYLGKYSFAKQCILAHYGLGLQEVNSCILQNINWNNAAHDLHIRRYLKYYFKNC